MQYFPKSKQVILPHSTLLVASVSVGNVGQLACELLLSTFNHTLIGYLHDESVLPCFGMDPFGEGSPCAMSLELYKLEDTKKRVYILQQRAPAQIGQQQESCQKLIDWIYQFSFQEILILGSVESTAREEDQLKTRQSWILHHPAAPPQSSLPALPKSILEALQDRRIPPWPLWKLMVERDRKGTLLVCFTVEGDNLLDGIQQAKEVNKLLNLVSNEQDLIPKLSPSIQWIFGSVRTKSF